MVKHNNIIHYNHFHKDWQRYVKTWYSQPFDKRRRQRKRQRKALKVAPRPEKGPIRPAVHCPSIRYNRKIRLGRGFTLVELKAADINKNFAKTIGISVDHRRRNKSYESIQKNKLRLQVYLNKLILFPKNEDKLKLFESNKEECKRAVQLKGIVMDIPKPKKHVKYMKLEDFKDAPSVYKILKSSKNAVKKQKSSKNDFLQLGEDK